MTDRQTDRQGGMLEINHLTACIEDEVGMTDRQTGRQGGMLEINHLTACIEDEVGMTDRQTDRQTGRHARDQPPDSLCRG